MSDVEVEEQERPYEGRCSLNSAPLPFLPLPLVSLLPHSPLSPVVAGVDTAGLPVDTLGLEPRVPGFLLRCSLFFQGHEAPTENASLPGGSGRRLRVSGSGGRGFWTAHMQGGQEGSACWAEGEAAWKCQWAKPGKSQEQPERRHRAEGGRMPRKGRARAAHAPSAAPEVMFPPSSERIAEACRLTKPQSILFRSVCF